MASAIPYLMGGSALFGAYSLYRGGQQAKEIALQNQALSNQTAADNIAIAAENARIAEQEAQAIIKKGGVDVGIKRKEIANLLAYQRTQEAVSGFKYTGTPIDVAAKSAEEGELDVATIWDNALTEAELTRSRGKVIQTQGERIAGQLRTQGDIMARQGSYAASAGTIGAASTLLGGISNAYMAYKYPMRINA